MYHLCNIQLGMLVNILLGWMVINSILSYSEYIFMLWLHYMFHKQRYMVYRQLSHFHNIHLGKDLNILYYVTSVFQLYKKHNLK